MVENMTSDPIADMLTRIRNVLMRGRSLVDVPYSKKKENLLKVLKENGYVDDIKIYKEKGSVFKNIAVTLAKDSNNKHKLTHLKRISRPGLRMYKSYREIRPILNGKGISVISTSRGVMRGLDAKKKKLGGEIICEIY